MTKRNTSDPLRSVPDLVRPETVLLAYRGSEARFGGTTLPPEDEFGTDDVDLVGAFVHPIEHYLGFGRRDTLERCVGEYHIVEYELRKLVNLPPRRNPNVLSMLWLPPECVLVSSPLTKRRSRTGTSTPQRPFATPFAATPRGSYGG